MDRELYCCSVWKHQLYKEYNVCVSDFVENKPFFQIHCVAFKNDKVVRGFRTSDLARFEDNIRRCVRRFINASGELPDEDEALTVKIWYYNPDDSRIDTNDIPLRIAITFYRPRIIETENKVLLKQQIYNELYNLLP